MQRIQSINQTVTQGAIKMYAPRESNPLRILVPGDDDSPSTACSSCDGGPNSPWPQLDQYNPGDDARAAFERASAAFDQAKPRWDMISREEGWKKEAPSKFLYSGKRSKTGMPDKRTKAGKAWYRDRELRAEILKATDPYSINCV